MRYKMLEDLKLDVSNHPSWEEVEKKFENQTLNITSELCENEAVASFIRHATIRLHDGYRVIDSHTFISIMTGIYVVIFILGTIGNFLTVAVIYKTPNLHSHTNYFLCSLACSDFLLVLVGVPSDLVVMWQPLRPPSFVGYCKLHSILISWFTNVSILTITSLTAERFIAICYPLHLRSYFNKPRVINFIKIIWILAIFPSALIGVQFEKTRHTDMCGNNYPEYGGLCSVPLSSAIPYSSEAMLILMFIIPMIFNLVCYLKIYQVLQEMAVVTTVHSPVTTCSSDSSTGILYIHTHKSAPHKSQQAQSMIIRMLMVISGVFFLCYFPFHVQRLIIHYNKEYCGSSELCWMLYPIAGVLQYISASLNPFFYNLMSLRFRIALKYWLRQMLISKRYIRVVRV
uniref:G-protein coupled receptors family 1 profile domain-containing protein n=1 Tax=Plectus sambesii TaxID=2011161 RepID=A0A914WVF6_9BILA